MASRSTAQPAADSPLIDLLTHSLVSPGLFSTPEGPAVQIAPKTELVAALAFWTKTPVPETRQRVREMFDLGIGPKRWAPLHDSEVASYIIGFLAAPTQKEGAATVQQVGGFEAAAALSAVGGRSTEVVEAILKHLPSLRTAKLRTALAVILRGLAEDVPVYVASLSADLPPYQSFRIRLGIGIESPVCLTYGPSEIARKLQETGDGWPIRTTREMDGRVLPMLVRLSKPDSVTKE